MLFNRKIWRKIKNPSEMLRSSFLNLDVCQEKFRTANSQDYHFFPPNLIKSIVQFYCGVSWRMYPGHRAVAQLIYQDFHEAFRISRARIDANYESHYLIITRICYQNILQLKANS